MDRPRHEFFPGPGFPAINTVLDVVPTACACIAP